MSEDISSLLGDYKLFDANSTDAFNEQMKKEIAEGWLPVHRPVIVYMPAMGNFKYFQSMFKGKA